MKKEVYEPSKLEIITLKTQDVILNSPPPVTENELEWDLEG